MFNELHVGRSVFAIQKVALGECFGPYSDVMALYRGHAYAFEKYAWQVGDPVADWEFCGFRVERGMSGDLRQIGVNTTRIPLWVVPVVLAVLFLGLLFRRWYGAHGRRIGGRRHHCECGYDLTGNISGQSARSAAHALGAKPRCQRAGKTGSLALVVIRKTVI